MPPLPRYGASQHTQLSMKACHPHKSRSMHAKSMGAACTQSDEADMAEKDAEIAILRAELAERDAQIDLLTLQWGHTCQQLDSAVAN